MTSVGDMATRALAAARKYAVPVYDKTICGASGCCGDLDGAIRTAVAATLAELSRVTGSTGPLGAYDLLWASTVVEFIKGDS